MEESVKKIGVMGGTFDPIHYGHLVLAETVREQFSLQKVLFIPAGDPPHKEKKQLTPAEKRLEMVRLAVRDNPEFQVSDMELKREGRSYTIDTIKQLHRDFSGSYSFYFITGADAVLEILSWKNVDELAELCTFIAATRPGTDTGKLRSFLAELPAGLKEKIHLTEVPALKISSTEIRRKVQSGQSIKYLLPPEVEEYIRNEGLYAR